MQQIGTQFNYIFNCPNLLPPHTTITQNNFRKKLKTLLLSPLSFLPSYSNACSNNTNQCLLAIFLSFFSLSLPIYFWQLTCQQTTPHPILPMLVTLTNHSNVRSLLLTLLLFSDGTSVPTSHIALQNTALWDTSGQRIIPLSPVFQILTLTYIISTSSVYLILNYFLFIHKVNDIIIIIYIHTYIIIKHIT